MILLHQSSHLLGHEEYRFPVMDRRCDDIGDGLRLAGPRRALHDEIAAGPDFLDHFGLRGVRINDLDDVGRIEACIEFVVGAEERGLRGKTI